MYDQPTIPPVHQPAPPKKSPVGLVVGVAVLLIALITGVVFIATSGDDGGEIRLAGPVSGEPDTDDTGTVSAPQVDGDPLPTWDEELDADDPALGYEIPTVTGTDYAGEPVVIEPGRATIVVVMAHWCPHCQAEIPRIVEWADEGMTDDVDVIGISTAVDESRGNFPPEDWLDDEGWPFPVMADDAAGTAMAAMGVTGFPSFISITAEGIVSERMSGEIDQGQFAELLDFATMGDPWADDDEESDDPPASVPDLDPGLPADCPAADGSSAQRQQFPSAPPMCIDPSRTYTAEVATNLGAFTIALDPSRAPLTVNNFVFLARYHYYDGIVFHRIIPGFMFQGGDPLGDGTGGPGYEFGDELPAEGDYGMYSVAMANAGANTNGSQFFVITGADGVALPPSYSLFGTVTDGTDIADTIGNVDTDRQDRPIDDVVIESVTISES